MKSDPKDWFVMILVAGIWIASTVYIFKHPDNTAFGIWAGLAGHSRRHLPLLDYPR